MPACFNLGYRYIAKAIIEISFGSYKKARQVSSSLLPFHNPHPLAQGCPWQQKFKNTHLQPHIWSSQFHWVLWVTEESFTVIQLTRSTLSETSQFCGLKRFTPDSLVWKPCARLQPLKGLWFFTCRTVSSTAGATDSFWFQYFKTIIVFKFFLKLLLYSDSTGINCALLASHFLYVSFLFKSAHYFVCLFFTWMCLRWTSWNTPISNKSASLISNRSVNFKNKKDGTPHPKNPV